MLLGLIKKPYVERTKLCGGSGLAGNETTLVPTYVRMASQVVQNAYGGNLTSFSKKRHVINKLKHVRLLCEKRTFIA